MAKDNKEMTSAEIRKNAIKKMLESLISGDSEEASKHLHEVLQRKTRSIILGESDDVVKEQSREAAFSNSGTVMDDDVKGNVKYKNGGKKTMKKHGNAPKELDDDKVEKVKFKNGGKQPAKTLEPTPKPEKFDDGRDFDLGTLDEGLLDEIYEVVMEKAPSAGLSKEKKAEIVKKARKGEDIGKKGKKFQEVVKRAKKYGAKDPEAVAAAAMWKNVKR